MVRVLRQAQDDKNGLLKQNADKNEFLLFLLFWNGLMKKKNLSLSPDSQLLSQLPFVPVFGTKDRANSGTTVD